MKRTSTTVVTILTFLLQGGVMLAQSTNGSPSTPTDVRAAEPAHTAGAPQADPEIVSNVRIVRLSLARGVVQMDRNTGRGAEPAIANMPIVKGAKLRTGEGVAEVEFEDNSSLRLIPHSAVSFDQLGRTASGSTVSTVSVLQGTAYVSLAKAKENVFNLVDGASKLALYPGTSVRFAAGTPEASLAVFQGEVQVEKPGGETALLKKQTLLFDPSSDAQPTLVHRTEAEAYDEWDKSQQDYHKGVATFAGVNGAGLYGASDLNYYGQFSNVGGCGNLWRPYFASAAWDPFANGAWALYPGAGYSWVSPYPWGWLPFHSGSWQYCGASGWGWQPGGQWYGLQNMATITKISQTSLQPRIPLPPSQGKATLIPVNTKPLVISGLSSTENFTFRRDSAGLGVPRETFGKLRDISSAAERRGDASTTAYVPASSGRDLSAVGTASRTPSQTSTMPPTPRASVSSAPRMSSAPAMSSGPAASAGGSPSSGGGAHR